MREELMDRQPSYIHTYRQKERSHAASLPTIYMERKKIEFIITKYNKTNDNNRDKRKNNKFVRSFRDLIYDEEMKSGLHRS